MFYWNGGGPIVFSLPSINIASLLNHFTLWRVIIIIAAVYLGADGQFWQVDLWPIKEEKSNLTAPIQRWITVNCTCPSVSGEVRCCASAPLPSSHQASIQYLAIHRALALSRNELQTLGTYTIQVFYLPFIIIYSYELCTKVTCNWFWSSSCFVRHVVCCPPQRHTLTQPHNVHDAVKGILKKTKRGRKIPPKDRTYCNRDLGIYCISEGISSFIILIFNIESSPLRTFFLLRSSACLPSHFTMCVFSHMT